MKTLIRLKTASVLLFATAATYVLPVSAQVKISEFEGTYIANNDVLAIANGRMAFVCSDYEGVYVSTYDSTSSLVWEKDYVVPKEKGRRDRFVTSADGKDIWVISTGDEVTVTCIDALSGDSKTKTHNPEEFGIVFSTWANSKYFFVMTTAHEVYEKDIASDPGVRVFRFEKSTLNMSKLDHDMERPTKFTNVFWEVLRVEEEFYEAYAVVSAGNMIEIKFGRFDNNAKELSTGKSEFMIKEPDHFTRQIHGFCTPGPGVGESNHSFYMYSRGDNYTVELIYPIASVQVAYCAKTKTYYVCGILGPGEQQRIGTVYDGFFLAKLNANYEVDKYKEYIDVPVYAKDKNFDIHATPDSRYIHCYFDPVGNPVVLMGAETAYMFTIDQTDLALTKSIEVEQEFYYIAGGVTNAGTNWLVSDPEAEEVQSRQKSFAVLVSGNWQYGLCQEYTGGDIKVLTKKVK